MNHHLSRKSANKVFSCVYTFELLSTFCLCREWSTFSQETQTVDNPYSSHTSYTDTFQAFDVPIFLHYNFIGYCNVISLCLCSQQSVLIFNVYWCSVWMEGIGWQYVTPSMTQLLHSLHNILLLFWCVGYTFPWQLHEHVVQEKMG